MQAIRVCVAATVRRDLKEPVDPVGRSYEDRVIFRWRRFLLLTYLVVTASTAQLCLMTQDEIRERKQREAQETRNRLRSANQEQQVAVTRKTPQPETFTHSDPSDHRSGFGSVQTTTNGRLGDADLGLSASYRTESVSRECIPGMDDVSVMWSTLESKDGLGRYSDEDGTDNRSTSSDTSLSRMCINDATTTDGKQNGDILRMQSVFSVQKSGAHISYYGITCFAVYALMSSSSTHGGASDVLDSDSVESEERFTMLNVPAESAVTPQGQQFLLEQLLHLSSSGITGQESRRAIVRMFPDRQQKVKVSKAVRVLQDTMQKI